MEQRVHFVTAATADLDAARRFYVDGLGWTTTLDVPGEILFFQIGPGIMLGLFDATKFSQDIDPTATDATRLGGVTLAYNVDSVDEVGTVIAEAERAGATILQRPQEAFFGGGSHAHFADPNGLIWEVAHNPGWRVDESGKVWLD